MNSSNKKILLTGSTGFLGHYLKSRLTEEQYSILTLGRNKCDIIHDLKDGAPALPSTISYVIHAAGKAHIVPKTIEEKELFNEINYKGTLNLLDGIKKSGSPVSSIIFISSVAVYGLSEGSNIDENTPLAATDAYGKSKIKGEQAIMEYCTSNKINYCILRLPLIAGNNPPGNLGDMIKAIKRGWYFSIGKANVKKSMVIADDVATLIPRLFNTSGIYNLTDGYHPTFGELEKALAKRLSKSHPVKIPGIVAKLMAKIGDLIGKRSPINSVKLKKIQSELTFSDTKAINELGWKPNKVIDHMAKVSA